ncbi:PQQ-dependent sugar dehydrogenase [Streptomyces sp. NPDC051219]|uniref:PQQ-dependent sugar dehydrogenase n=1 Tax=Streptomyces sp. NPDC051219 TaxID=3155283 RepID=UPI0034322F4C
MLRSTRAALHPGRLGTASLALIATTLAAGLTPMPSAGAAQPAAPRAVSRAADSQGQGSEPGGAPTSVTEIADGFTEPWTISFLPDGQSALTTERNSFKVWHVLRDGSKELVGRIPHSVVTADEKTKGDGGLLGVAPSPTWDGVTDQDVFFMHTTATGNRIAKMRFDGASLSDYTPVLTGIRKARDHNGGKIAFGPDGYLYVTTGDAWVPELAQDKESLNGKILRITTRGEPAPGNPFGNHVYSYGHRNPQGLAWDRRGRLWSAEIGDEKYDELNLIKPGKNYGWPACEGPCRVEGMTNPKHAWRPAEAVPSQIAVVSNVIYVSTLLGSQLWRVPIDGDSDRVGVPRAYYRDVYGRLRALAKVPGKDQLWMATNAHGPGKDKILKVTITVQE